MNELDYEVGKPFPNWNDIKSHGTYPIFTNEGLDILIIMGGITDDIIESFNHERPRYMVLNFSNIPFLNLSFTKQLGVGCHLNVYRLLPEKSWLVSTPTKPVMRLFLVEEGDFTIKSIQTISPEATFIADVKEILQRQLEQYTSSEQVDNKKIGLGLRELSESMMKQWLMKDENPNKYSQTV